MVGRGWRPICVHLVISEWYINDRKVGEEPGTDVCGPIDAPLDQFFKVWCYNLFREEKNAQSSCRELNRTNALIPRLLLNSTDKVTPKLPRQIELFA